MKLSQFVLVVLIQLAFARNVTGQNPGLEIDSLLNVLRIAKEDTAKINLLNKLGSSYRLNKQPEIGKRYNDTAFLLARKLGFRKGEADANAGFGHYYFNLTDQHKEAIRKYQAALTIYEEIGYKPGVIGIYFNLGNLYINTSDYKEALKYHQLSLKTKLETGTDKKSIANSYNNIGLISQDLGNLIEAAKNHLAALAIWEELGIKRGIGNSLINMGVVYNMQGNYPAALKYYYEALKISEQNNDKSLMADCYNNIGIIHDAQKNYPEAIKNYSAALKINREMGIKYSMAQNNNNLGVVYRSQARYPEALNAYQTARKLFEEAGSKEGVAECLTNMGVVNMVQDNFTEANKYFLAALELAEKTGVKSLMVSNYLNLGDMQTAQAATEKSPASDLKYKEALQNINKGLSLAKEISALESITEAYDKMAKVYTGMNDHKNALVYKDLYAAFKDSLMNNETTRKLEQQRTQYEVEKAVAEEKVAKDKALAEERLAGEKKLADERLLQERLLADERVANEKRLADERTRHELLAAQEKYMYELALADERTEQERIKAEEQLKKEQMLAEEKYKSGLVLAATKAEQEKEKTAIKRRNELLLAGAGMLLVSLVFIFLYQRQRTLKQRAIERADAVHKMAELELQSLRAQLNPHFMFNSLNAIQELILMEDNERSHTYLSRFSKLIRMLLDNASQPFIPLRKEIDFLELYLSLEKLRVPDLQYKIEIDPGVDTNSTTVPNMMLQPYIENAIWHGLSPKASDKKLKLHIYRQNGTVNYIIEDNGIGRKKAAEFKSLYRKEHKSKGMELLTKRFKLLSEEFGSEIKTEIKDLPENEGGTRVTISVPKQLSVYKKETIA